MKKQKKTKIKKGKATKDKMPSFLKLKVGFNNQNLNIKCTVGDRVFWREKKMAGVSQDENTNQMVLFWLLNEIKPLFFSMPVEKIYVELSEESKSRFGGFVNYCANCLTITNETIKQYAALKNIAAENRNLLFFNVNENIHFKSFYEQLDPANSQRHVYMSFNPGFNHITRQWEKTDAPISVDEFVNKIQTEKLSKILSINHYLLEKYFEQGIYIIALFKYLGVEYVIFDHDPWDQSSYGYLSKAFFNCSDFNRFSYAYSHKYWDKYYSLKNVHHVALTNKYLKKYSPDKLPDDYNIVIMSNARIPEVLSFLNPMMFLLSHFKGDSFFEEIELWYYSLRYMILNIMDFNEFEKLHYNCMLLRFIYAISQFVKYDVIDSIHSDRKIELYGDNGWAHIFPEIYKTYLDRNSIDQMFAKRQSLYLLMNIQTTWLETSAAIYEAINSQLPFINHPALVRTDELSGLSNIEYRNPVELNDKINNINKYINDDVVTSIRFLNDISNDCMQSIDKTLHNKGSYSSENTFGVQLNKHDDLLGEKIYGYIDKNEDFLRYTFKSLFLESVQYNIEESKYFPKQYMQRLIYYAQRSKK